MAHRRTWILCGALLAAGCGGSQDAPGPGPAPAPAPAPTPAAPPRGGAADMSGFTAMVTADEFNDRVTDATRNDPPVRGGTLRVRLPSFPAGLNRHIQSHNTTGRRLLSWYLNTEMVLMDLETLEWLPYGAKYWTTQDILDLEGGERLVGRILSETDDAIEFAVGARQATVNKFESKRDGDTVTLDTGETFTGPVTAGGRYTWRIEDRSGAETRSVPRSRLAAGNWENAGKPMPGRKPNVIHTMHIRKGLRWDDGHPHTADDVVFTVNDVILNEFVPCPHLRVYYASLESCKALDDHTVEFIWKKPYFQSLDYSGRVRTVPKHVFWKPEYAGDPKAFGTDYAKHPANEKPVGMGPFRLKEWNKQAQVLTLERNPDYFAGTVGFPWYAKGRPYLDRVQFVVIKENNAAVKGITSGDIDFDNDVEPDTWRREDTQSATFTSHIARVTSLAPNYTYIGWNMRRPFFQDKRVRRALTMLIPRAQILSEIHNGLGQQTTGPFFVNSPAYDPTVQPIPYDPKGARELLEEAGFADRDGDRFLDYRGEDGEIHTFEFQYLIHNARAYHEKIAVKVRESLKRAGIKVTIEKIDWTVFGKQVQDRRFDAVRFAWSPQIDPDPYQIWHSTQSEHGSNYVAFRNPEVDRIIEEARITFDAPKRWALLRRMHRIVHDEQPYTFMFFFQSLAFYDKDCRGVRFYKTEAWRPVDLTEWWLPKAAQERRAKRG